MAGLQVPSAILTGADSLIRAYGQDPVGIARRADLPSAALHDNDLRVSPQVVLRFFELAASTCGDRNWGLELASGARLAAVIGPLWILLRNARTVREMCLLLADNFDLYSSAAVMVFEQGPGEGGVLAWSPAVPVEDGAVQMTEYALALFCNELRSHCPPGWRPQAALFSHTAPDDLRLHYKLFGDNLRFDQDRNALLLDGATLRQRLQSQTTLARSMVHSILRHEQDVGDADTASQVESIVRTLMPYGPCNLREVSLAMALAPRTLQQHLQIEDTSFQRIRGRVRAELALKYVRDSRLSAVQIAEILGYMDATTLSRSFRRWHGRSIRETRRQLARDREAN